MSQYFWYFCVTYVEKTDLNIFNGDKTKFNFPPASSKEEKKKKHSLELTPIDFLNCIIAILIIFHFYHNKSILDAAAKSLQSCLTLGDPIDGSPPGSPTPGILQARTLEWVAISFFNAWKWKVKVKSLSCVWPSATPWTAAFQAPPSMGFSRQEYWSGVPLPSPNPSLVNSLFF